MDDREVHEIMTLLREGQEAEARTLFMTHLLEHCRALDQTLGKLLGWETNTDDYLWQVFKEVQHMGWFHFER